MRSIRGLPLAHALASGRCRYAYGRWCLSRHRPEPVNVILLCQLLGRVKADLEVDLSTESALVNAGEIVVKQCSGWINDW